VARQVGADPPGKGMAGHPYPIQTAPALLALAASPAAMALVGDRPPTSTQSGGVVGHGSSGSHHTTSTPSPAPNTWPGGPRLLPHQPTGFSAEDQGVGHQPGRSRRRLFTERHQRIVTQMDVFDPVLGNPCLLEGVSEAPSFHTRTTKPLSREMSLQFESAARHPSPNQVCGLVAIWPDLQTGPGHGYLEGAAISTITAPMASRETADSPSPVSIPAEALPCRDTKPPLAPPPGATPLSAHAVPPGCCGCSTTARLAILSDPGA